MSDALPSHHTIAGRYAAMVAAGEIEDDPAQRGVVHRLDDVADRLGERRVAVKRHPLGWLFGRRQEAAPPVRGLYIHGAVGRGKTMLMDLFFQTVSVRRKRRAHFHEFMADIHERVHRARKAPGSAGDPILPVAEALAEEVRLLCFDEFAVNDIADAMILGRLFDRLFSRGVVMVATSNVAPDDLYHDGINRGHFLPFIALLKHRVEIVRLDARTDFRLEKLSGAPAYVTPLGPDADRALDEIWRLLTGTGAGRPAAIAAKGREIVVPQADKGVARFGFADLCEAPLGSADFLRIARAFHTVILDGVPTLSRERRNAAKRFINLVDVLYDNNIRLVVSAEAEPDALYRGASGTEAFEFARTASRLTEMRSEAYLAAAGPADRPGAERSADPSLAGLRAG